MLALLPLLLDSALPPQISVTEALAIPPVSVGGRVPAPIDAIQRLVVEGRWVAPREGDEVERHDGAKRKWTKLAAGQDGWFSGQALGGGYLYATVESPRTRVMLLSAAGHGMVYVNGEPRAGDPYGYGNLRQPVELRQGRNEFLFQVPRGRLKFDLVEAKEPAQLVTADPTLPDLLVAGERLKGAVVVANNSTRTLKNLAIEATVDGEPVRTAIREIGPLTFVKVPFDIVPQRLGKPGEQKLALRLLGSGRELDVALLPIRRRLSTQSHKRTFVSEIDGSVQYYAVQPRIGHVPAESRRGAPALPLVLSLHGASVEAMGQADAYAPNPWATIVCPTNRRPYGFDWEDWGRLDALEVMRDAERVLRGKFVGLTGHSMGGHGTWHLGVTFPGRFGAIGPSAGWVSFFSYAGGRRIENPDPVEALLGRATNPSDTLSLATNLRNTGVYILHGDADDNVPVTEARTMAAKLKELNIPFGYHEQPGAGHWWETSDEPGAECVDWPPLFDTLARHRPDVPQRQIDFSTANPFVSSESRWVRILQQQVPLAFSRVQLQYDPHKARIVGKTDNVAAMAVDLHGKLGLDLDLDGQKLRVRKTGTTHALLRKGISGWTQIGSLATTEKNPARSGPFKNAFGSRMMLVYGTRGTAEENRWAYAKARFDAESFTYRGNGTPLVLADADFTLAKTGSVIVYGNERTNSAFEKLGLKGPVQVGAGEIALDARRMNGSFAVLAVRPRPDSASAMVGIVGGTDLVAMRLTDRLPYFTSGVAYPDWCVLTPESLTTGTKGVIAAGYFDNAWRFDPSQSAFR